MFSAVEQRRMRAPANAHGAGACVAPTAHVGIGVAHHDGALGLAPEFRANLQDALGVGLVPGHVVIGDEHGKGWGEAQLFHDDVRADAATASEYGVA